MDFTSAKEEIYWDVVKTNFDRKAVYHRCGDTIPIDDDRFKIIIKSCWVGEESSEFTNYT